MLKRSSEREVFCVPREHSPNMLQSINTERCIVVHSSTWSHDEYSRQLLFGLQLASVVRCLICNFQGYIPPRTCRLLRVLQGDDMYSYIRKSSKDEYFGKDIFQLVNLRYLALTVGPHLNPKLTSSMGLLWNLQTLIINGDNRLTVAPSEIWMMPQLRHVKFRKLYLPDPPSVEEDKPVFVLRNLQTLSRIINFRCGEDVVKRISNIKILKVVYSKDSDEGSRTDNFSRLHELESLACNFGDYMDKRTHSYLLQNLTFPHSLRKVALTKTRLDWEEMSTKVGSLPLLQVLKLNYNSCKGPEWKPVEDQFCSLKYLQIQSCDDLEYWTADETNFPCLEQLVLEHLDKLKEVPSGIGDIPTLRSIEVDRCCDSAVISAKKIADEQEELENLDLKVQVSLWKEDTILERLRSRNFQVLN
ncbi:hypothetical protein BUALT_Bualt07G0162800 [Buddleja alternifolia]|uniref:Disease resistance R13L4/SHOC-2-like LRR domain-containing protein n=1 Tax=Buddleja alternifolia TaxID=168488 RepID=A0AAV6XHR4_9LAMI|nr:hypothetical protein BUALT_Bualt07G0162800 [Buddleja alternifolia]